MVFEASADQKTVGEFLEEKNTTLGEKDYIFPAPEAKIFPGGKIIIRRALPVAISVDGQKIKLDTLGTSVREPSAKLMSLCPTPTKLRRISILYSSQILTLSSRE